MQKKDHSSCKLGKLGGCLSLALPGASQLPNLLIPQLPRWIRVMECPQLVRGIFVPAHRPRAPLFMSESTSLATVPGCLTNAECHGVNWTASSYSCCHVFLCTQRRGGEVAAGLRSTVWTNPKWVLQRRWAWTRGWGWGRNKPTVHFDLGGICSRGTL